MFMEIQWMLPSLLYICVSKFLRAPSRFIFSMLRARSSGLTYSCFDMSVMELMSSWGESYP